MDDLDDLWSSLTAELYDHRIALAVASAAGVIALAILARRMGWLSAARRHPGRSTAGSVAVLLVALPLLWYVASPVFIRSVLVEPPPVDAASGPSVVPAPTPDVISAPTPSHAQPTAAATALEASTPFAPATLARGSFHGSDDFHFGRGSATVIEVSPGRYHLRLEDFSVRNGPDLYVYLSPSADGYAKGAVELGKLKATDGAFGYDIPPDADPASFQSAIIWCKQFRHLFATAPFAPA
jgi:hypothetical protein